MKKYRITYMMCTAVVVGTGLGAAPPAARHAFHVVMPGQSIQKAVDASKPGDTVLVAPGTFHESIKVTTPGLTLRGMGRATVIEPSGKKAANSCAEGGNGICVLGTKDRDVKGVTIASLTVTGFARTGVFAMATDQLTVRNVTTARNGVWGIAQERSVRSVIQDNSALNNGDAGVFLANTINEEAGATDTGGTLIDHNRLEGNRIGVTVRRLRNLTVARNRATANCVAVFVVGDENKPKAGALTVRDNLLVRNNKSCPKTARLDALQGSGIVLTGAEDTLVTRNVVRNNVGNSSMSGGIVLFKSFVGVTSDRNRINDNVVEGNSPADLINADHGTGNTFERNSCRASQPAGMC
ncbi:right-handed parallel beta-helix repeat-containing protein [Streptomyces longisporus]|uniref:Right-handed parallel beta-helix repeat-containing protein n=1 Tax=Streptomyces longisporus TaxID=1948 RepID=A0ABN3L6A0_STRLO